MNDIELIIKEIKSLRQKIEYLNERHYNGKWFNKVENVHNVEIPIQHIPIRSIPDKIVSNYLRLWRFDYLRNEHVLCINNERFFLLKWNMQTNKMELWTSMMKSKNTHSSQKVTKKEHFRKLIKILKKCQYNLDPNIFVEYQNWEDLFEINS